MAVRVKTIKSGPLLEIEIYTISEVQKNTSRAKKKKASSRHQKHLNYRNRVKKLYRLVNANFTVKDIMVTCTYEDGKRPVKENDAQRDIQNFIRRIKYARKKKGLPDLKYIAIIERDNTGKIHHHLFMSGGLDRDFIEQTWGLGYCNSKRLQANSFGFMAAAVYAGKDSDNSKRRMQSKNLVMPSIGIVDSRFKTLKKAGEYALGYSGQLEKDYPDYEIVDCSTLINQETNQVSYEVFLRRKT